MSQEKKSKVEIIKEESNFLRGTLAEELDNDLDHISKTGLQLLKFHGSYQQDDRDLRKGGDRHYQMMVRTRLPGGGITGEQYLVLDEISEKYGNGAFRITTRQDIQLHGVLKSNLRTTINEINQSLLTTLGACGDVVRNVICNPAPTADGRQAKVQEYVNILSQLLRPETRAYHELWLDGEKVYSNREEVPTVEPIYGKTYLPRKFKIAITVPGDNSIGVYSNDIGLIAFFDEQENITGFNVAVGGGMGMTHNKPDTFPRLGDEFGYVPADRLIPMVKGIIGIQKDFGNRSDRRYARMKYLLHEWGVDRFRKELVKRTGFELEPFRTMPKFELELYLGWHKQPDGRWYLGINVENGRVKDDGSLRLKTGLREVIKKYRPNVRLTTNQSILLTDIDESHKEKVETALRSYGIAMEDELSNVLKYSMACPALPTCGLAVAESERVLPGVIRELERELEKLGLADEKLSVRMTGCPNGCARPYVADIAFVGRSLNKYSILVGGNPTGTRLNTKYKDLVELEDLVKTVVPLLEIYKQDRFEGETFGDYWNRVGLETLEEAVVE